MWMLQLSVMIALIWRMNLWNIIKTVTHPQSLGISFTINLLSKRRFALFAFSWRSLLSLIVNSVKIQFFFFVCCLPRDKPETSQWDSDLTRGFVTVTRTCLVASLTGICWLDVEPPFWINESIGPLLNQSVLPSNCVWTFQPWTACLMAA